jgi:transcriptional regulator with XRE-family HTH domain
MTDAVGPAIARERLRTRLRELRELRGLPTTKVAAAMSWSLSKLNRIETGAVTVQPIEVQVLLDLYRVDDAAEVAALKELSTISRERRWWSEHGLSPEFKRFIAYEDEASRLYGYQALFVPGLLQTADYAREIIAQIIQKSSGDPDVAERVEVRMKRQDSLLRRLESDSPPALTFVIDESVLLRPIGGTAAMHAQLDHLLRMTTWPTVHLAITPLHVGGHAGLAGTFELLEFAGEDDLDVVFIESAASDILETDPEKTQSFREVIDALLAFSPTGDEALAEIRKARRAIRA